MANSNVRGPDICGYVTTFNSPKLELQEVVTPADRAEVKRARRDPEMTESIGEISASAGRWPGFREFSARKERNKGSRRSFNIVARRGSGTVCPRSLRSVFMGGRGASRSGRQGHPSPLSRAAWIAVRDRQAGGSISIWRRPDVASAWQGGKLEKPELTSPFGIKGALVRGSLMALS